MTLGGCTVTNNTARYGGGIFNDWQGHLTILSSVVCGNLPSWGHDIYDFGWMQISTDSSIGRVSYHQ
jgi:hypothetical protein